MKTCLRHVEISLWYFCDNCKCYVSRLTYTKVYKILSTQNCPPFCPNGLFCPYIPEQLSTFLSTFADRGQIGGQKKPFKQRCCHENISPFSWLHQRKVLLFCDMQAKYWKAMLCCDMQATGFSSIWVWMMQDLLLLWRQVIRLSLLQAFTLESTNGTRSLKSKSENKIEVI